MPVAKAQLPELIRVIRKAGISPASFRRVMIYFQDTEAYKKNKSFRDTVDRFLEIL